MSSTERQGMLDGQSTLAMLNSLQENKDEDKKPSRSCWSIACGCCIRGEQKFKDFLELVFFQAKTGRYLEITNGLLMMSSATIYVCVSYMSDQEGIYESEWF